MSTNADVSDRVATDVSIAEMRSRIAELEIQLALIHERNTRVEAEKAWEISLTRRVLVAVLTFLVILAVFAFQGDAHPARNAMIPAIGYVLSTFTIRIVRRVWQEGREKCRMATAPR